MVSLVGFLLRNVAKGIEVILFYFLRLSDFRFSQWIIVYVLDFFTVGLANATLKLASYFSRGSCTIKMALNWQKPNKGVRNVFLSQKLLITLAENFEFQTRLFTLIHFDLLFTPHHTVNFLLVLSQFIRAESSAIWMTGTSQIVMLIFVALVQINNQ